MKYQYFGLFLSEEDRNALLRVIIDNPIICDLVFQRGSALDLIENPNVSNSRKRIRLIEDGYKEDKCERCGLSEWMGMKIPLELHHKDNNHYNNKLDNLMIVCSNCHMQLHNYNNN